MPTEPVLPESELRLRVQQRIEDGRLPLAFITLVSSGFGIGHPCLVCDQPVTHHKIEYDVTDPRNSSRLTLHFACYVAWQRECARRIRAGEQPDQPEHPD